MLSNVKNVLSIISLLLFLFLIGAGINVIKSADAEEAIVTNSVDLKDSEIETLMEEFMARLVQPTDENYRALNFTSKEELITHFSDIANSKTAKMFIDEYYYEEANELYIIPTETPPWLIPENEYEFKKIDNYHYRLSQRNHTDLYGTYSIIVTFSYEDGQWLIADVMYGNSI